MLIVLNMSIHGNTSHGMTGTRTYRIWGAMLYRCKRHKHYAGRGIKVCRRWRRFELFYRDMGAAPENLSLDRINNDGNYEPSNCRWTNQKTQMGNRRNNVSKDDHGTVLSVRVTSQLKAKISRSSRIASLSESYFVRQILEKYLEARK